MVVLRELNEPAVALALPSQSRRTKLTGVVRKDFALDLSGYGDVWTIYTNVAAYRRASRKIAGDAISYLRPTCSGGRRVSFVDD